MPGGGNPNPPDKPGVWKSHEVQGATEARVWIEEKIAEGYKCLVVAYKYADDQD